MEAKITFKDGTEIAAEASGSCFITETKPEFPEDLTEVTVEIDETERTLNNVMIQECASVDNRFWFALIEESESDRVIRELREENAALRAVQDYNIMMGNLEDPSEEEE